MRLDRLWLAIAILLCGVYPAHAQYAPIPNYTGTGAGASMRNDLNNRLSGVTPIAPKLVSLPFASLPTEVDGQSYYVSNGSKTAPCTGGGTGAYARGLAGVWDCRGETPFSGGSISQGIAVTSTQFLDNFTRGDTALGTLVTADSGQTYTVSGPNVANLQVLNHAATARLGSSQYYFAPNGLTGTIGQIGARITQVAGSGSGTATVEVLGSSGVGGLLNQMLHAVNNQTAGAVPRITLWNGVSQDIAPAGGCTSISSQWEQVAVGDVDIISMTVSGSPINHVTYQEIYPDGTTATEDCTDPAFATVWGNGLLPTFEAGGQAAGAIVPTFSQVWASNAQAIGSVASSSTVAPTGVASSFSGGLSGTPIGYPVAAGGSFTGVSVGNQLPPVGGQLSVYGGLSTSAIVPNVSIDNSGAAGAPVLLFRNTTGGAVLGCIDWTFDTTTATAPMQICTTNARILQITRAGVVAVQVDNNRQLIVSSTHLSLQQAAPANTSGCGGSGLALAGTDNNGQITIGATPSTCVVNYNFGFTTAPSAAPICIRNSAGTMTLLPCTSSSTQLTLNPGGTPPLTAADVISWIALTGK